MLYYSHIELGQNVTKGRLPLWGNDLFLYEKTLYSCDVEGWCQH